MNWPVTSSLHLASLIGACLMLTNPVSAALIASFNGQDPGGAAQTDAGAADGYAANFVATNVSATPLTAAAGTNGYQIGESATDHASAPFYQIRSNSHVSNGMPNDGPGSPQQTLAMDNDSYFGFTLQADPGYAMILDTISLDVGQGTGSNTQERGYAVYSSLDGYTSALVADATIGGYRENGGGAWESITIPLGGAVAQAVDFRLYVFAGDGAGTGSNIEFDNIQVTGAVVPEPAACTLLVLGLVGFGWAARRRQGATRN